MDVLAQTHIDLVFMTSASMNPYTPFLVDSFDHVLLLSYPSLTPTMQLLNCSESVEWFAVDMCIGSYQLLDDAPLMILELGIIL